MAEDRVFTLIGKFDDQITPALENINKSVDALRRTMSTMSTKKGGGFSDVTQSVGKLVSAQKHLKTAITEVGEAARKTTQDLGEYKKVVGKVASAHFAIARAGNQAGKKIAEGYKEAYDGIDKLDRRQKLMLAAARRRNRLITPEVVIPSSRTSRAARTRDPRPQDYGDLGGGGGGGGGRRGGGSFGGDFSSAGAIFGFQVGNTIGRFITDSIMTGFQFGVGLMTKPFQYFANNFKERVQDELSDLKAAGGMFAISREQQGEKFIKTFQDAIDFTQENNTLLSKIAGSLPGSTQDYIEVSKRISDSIFRTVVTDQAASVKLAEKIRSENPELYGREAIVGEGAEQQKRAVQTILGDLTTKTVLAGQGGRAGVGGTMGAYGLPQLTERMLSQDQVTMGQFQRYAAIFSDPMIMAALEKEIPKINATAKTTAARAEALRNLYERVLPPELIERYRRTFAGLTESINTAIFSPENGLLGLGRKVKGLGRKMNEFGEYIDEAGEVTEDVTKAAKQDLSIYDSFRDTFANVGQILLPIIENLDLLWDPLRALGIDLSKAREVTGRVLQSFNYYLNGFKEFADSLKNEEAKKAFNFFGAPLRASLATIANLLADFEVISDEDFFSFMDELKSPTADVQKMLKNLVDQFLDSEVATKIGKFIGGVIATVLTEVANVTGFLSERIEKTSGLVSGVLAGFSEGKGKEAISNILNDLFAGLWRVVKFIWDNTNWQTKALAIGLALLPAFISLAANMLVTGVGRMILAIAGGALNLLKGTGKKAANDVKVPPSAGGGTGGGGRNILSGLFSTPSTEAAREKVQTKVRKTFGYQGYTAPIGPVEPMRDFRGANLGIAKPGAELKGTSYPTPGRMRLNEATEAVNVAKGTLNRVGSAAAGAAGKVKGLVNAVGKGNIALGVLDAVIRTASGESLGKAIGGAAATTVGATVGGILGQAIIPVPGVGAAIGSVAGGFLGDKIFSSMWPASKEQMDAAGLQTQAAEMNVAASKANTLEGKLQIPSLDFQLGEWTEVKKRFEALGYAGNESAQAIVNELRERNAAQAAAEKAVKAYEEMAPKVADMKLPEAEKNKLLKPFEDAVAAAATKLEKEQADLSAAMNAAPKEITDALTQNILTTPLTALDAALAEAVRKRKQPVDYGPTVKGAVSDVDAAIMSSYGRYGDQGSFANYRMVDPRGKFQGNLGDAVASEMKNKPAGSDLIVANSSETVIPAAGGYGMENLFQTFRMGFDSMVSAFKSGEKAQKDSLETINETLKSNLETTRKGFETLSTKFTTPSVPGGLGGAAAGGADAFTGIAQSFGLQMTSGYRPGDPGWHGADRARDFSNSTGPTPQMLQFAQYLAQTYGSNLKELIYTPLGYAIKNGQVVPPYAQGSHYNHVHVAYAFGPENGMGFQSLRDAESFERSMVPGSVKVASVTANSGEMLGGETNVVNNITINQQPGQSTEDLAYAVVKAIEASMDQGSSLFV